MNQVSRPPVTAAGHRWTDEGWRPRLQLADYYHAAASCRLIQADGVAGKVFDATVRRMQAAQR